MKKNKTSLLVSCLTLVASLLLFSCNNDNRTLKQKLESTKWKYYIDKKYDVWVPYPAFFDVVESEDGSARFDYKNDTIRVQLYMSVCGLCAPKTEELIKIGNISPLECIEITSRHYINSEDCNGYTYLENSYGHEEYGWVTYELIYPVGKEHEVKVLIDMIKNWIPKHILPFGMQYKYPFKREKSWKTQAEMNEAYYNGYVVYKDYVELEFQKLLEALPKYRKELLKEKSVWEMYLRAAQEVSRYEDNGSCTPLHVVDVLAQATQIRSVAQHSLFRYVQGKDIPHSKKTFNPSMIADAYSAYIKAVGEDEFVEQKTKYQESLRKEQRCWDDLVKRRNEISQLLNGDLKKAYEIGTNQMLGIKLYQMKSQINDLGMTCEEILKCVLSEDSSDKVFLEYPRFDKVWAKYSEK